MSDHPPAAPGQPSFVRGNERLDQLLADPQLAADVAAAHADAEEMDRVDAMNLAMIRKAAQMTQVEVARKLGLGQGVVSRLEHRDDMLLSTLYGQGRSDYARLRPWITAYHPRGTFRGTVFWL